MTNDERKFGEEIAVLIQEQILSIESSFFHEEMLDFNEEYSDKSSTVSSDDENS